jgi:surface protein
MSGVAAMMGVTSSISGGGGGATVDTDFVFKVSMGSGGSFNIPHYPGLNYNYNVDWGDSSNSTNVTNSPSHTYGSGTFTIRISGTFPAIFFDNTGDRLKVASVDNLGDVGWTTFDEAFFGCSNMTSFTAGAGANTASVTDMNQMLRNCTSLTSVDLSDFDTSEVLTMTNTFRNCNSLTTLDLSTFNTEKVTTMREMFFDCIDLTTLDISNFNTSSCTSFYQMFRDCDSLTSIDVSSFSAGTSSTGSVTTMNAMFRECTLLTDIPGVENFDITGLSGTSALTNFMVSGGSLPTTRYDTLLDKWEAQAGQISAQSPHFGTSKYSASQMYDGVNDTPEGSRHNLVQPTASGGYGWTITDGGQAA